MAEVTINNSPVHSDTILTALFNETGPNWSRFHTGTDFAPYGSTPSNPLLYSVCNGTVVNVISYTGSEALGNQIVILDSTTGHYWRYCHMVSRSPLSIGDAVNTSTVVGQMGATGNVTGVHLHLELSTTSYWSYDTFLDPEDALGLPHARGTIVHYDGTPTPPEPEPTEQAKKKHRFNWQTFTKNIRNRRNLTNRI